MKNEKFAKLKNLLGKGDGWKKKLSIFLALSLILSGVKGISLLGIGRENDAPEGNTVEIRGDRIKLHLEGETVRELAEKAVREGKLICAENGELSYSRNEELLERYRELFSEEREVYELPLDQVVEGLDELSAVGGKVRAFVEVDPKKQRGNTEKDSMDAVALFSGDSAFGRLLLAVKGESYFASVRGRDVSSVSGEEAAPGGEGGPGQEVKEKKESAGITGPGQGLQAEIETEQTEVVRPGQWIYPENTESREENAPKQELHPGGETENQVQENEENIPHGEGIEGPGSEVGASKESAETGEVGPAADMRSAGEDVREGESQELSTYGTDTEALSGEGTSSNPAADSAASGKSSIEEGNAEDAGNSGEAGLTESRAEIPETIVETVAQEETRIGKEETTAESETEKGTTEESSETAESSAGEEKEKQDRTEYQLEGTELIYFLYENEGDDDLSFHLFVSENSYPKIRVPGRNKVGRQLLQDGNPGKAENVADSNGEEEKEADAENRASGSGLSLDKDGIKVLYKEMKDGPDEYFSELRAVKLQEYSLNELGRISQNIEVEGFGTVEVFYDKDDFTEKVDLKASLLKKPEEVKEEQEGEATTEEKEETVAEETVAEETVSEETVAKETEAKKTIVEEASTEEGATVEEALSEDGSDTGTAKGEKARTSDVLEENEVEALKENGIYDQSISLDIHFEDKKGQEVEPSSSVSMRFYIAKTALPEEVNEENISIHHLVEKENGEIDHVELLSAAKSSAEEPENEKEIAEAGEESAEKTETEKEIISQTESGNTEKENSEFIVREFEVKSFSTYSLTWSSGKANNKNYKFFFVDGDFRQMGPNIDIDMSKFLAERPLFQNKYYNPYHLAYPDEILYLCAPFAGYSIHMRQANGVSPVSGPVVYPASLPLSSMNTESNRNTGVSWPDPVVYLTTKRVIRQWHYDTNQYINNPATYWADLGSACSENYYLFYKLNEKTHTHSYPKYDMEMQKEKYITKKSDGSYDLTLTARPSVAGEEKNKLDIIVVYDKSIYMALDFMRTVSDTEEFPYDDARADNDAGSKHRYGKLILDSLLDDIAKNPAYDAQFALVTMGGKRNLNLNGGEFSVSDDAYNDAEKVIGFTKNITAFKQELDSISIEKEKKKAQYQANAYEHHGLNYAAGIKAAEDFQNGAVVGTDCEATRSDARRVVLFVTAYNPNFSYFPKYEGGGNTNYFLRKAEDIYGNATGQIPGKVVDRLQLGPSRNKSLNYYNYFMKPDPSYLNFGPYAGYSYGSGRGFEEVALTQARGALTELNEIDAFYAIGLGPDANYSHLEDLIGAKRYWAENGHPSEQPLSSDIEQSVIKITSNSSTTDLTDIKNGLRSKIAPIRISDVNIWDQLSENVEVNFDNSNPVDKAAKLRAEVWKVDDDGKPISKLENPDDSDSTSRSLGFSGFKGVEATYDPVGKIIELKTKPGDFSFPKGYEIRLTVNVKPTQKAYEKYQKNVLDYFDKDSERWTIAGTKDIGYLDNVKGDNTSGTRTPDLTSSLKEGDIRTDQWYLYEKIPEEEFHTSSEKEGFYSNEGAYLKYVRFKDKNTREEPPEKKYQKPVIQVDPGTIRIVKSFKGTETDEEELELLKSCSFKLEEQIPGSTNFRKVNGIAKFTMTKSETETDYGPLVTEEYRGTKVTGVGKNLTPIVPPETVHGGKKQYVLTITGLVPGRKYRISEIMAAAGEEATISGRILRFKNLEIAATTKAKNASRTYEVGTLTLAENETKELGVKNVYEEDDKQILRIEKQVSGDLADKNQVFSFRLKLFKPDGVAINQTEFNTLKAGFSTDTQGLIQFNLNAGDSFIAFSLKHGQAIEFVLPKNYKYMVGEKPLDYAPEVSTGYALQNLDAVGYRYTDEKDVEKKLDGSKEVLVFTNHRDPIPPMGLVGLGEIWRRNLILFSLFIGIIFILKKRKLLLYARDCDK